MPAAPGAKSRARNDARRNGKAWKQKPGVTPKAHTGRTKGGYTSAALERRAARRTPMAVAAAAKEGAK